jgi:hypothetical protein
MIERLRSSIGATGSVIALLCSCQPGYCFTQTDCNQLAKTQSDPAGREVVGKLRADAKGACMPEQPDTKEPKTSSHPDQPQAGTPRPSLPVAQ